MNFTDENNPQNDIQPQVSLSKEEYVTKSQQTSQTAYPQPQASQTAYPQPQASQTAYPQPQASQTVYPQPQASQNVYPQPQASQNVYPQPQASQTAYPQPQASQTAYPQPQISQTAYPPMYPQENFSNPYAQQNFVPNNIPQNTPTNTNEYLFDPNMTYYPYYNGMPVPYGATTHYINGRWYYALPGADPKRKMALSVKVLICIIIAMAIGMTVAFFWWSSANASQNGDFNWQDFYKKYQLPDNNNQKDKDNSSDIIGKYADPDGPEISLGTMDTSVGSTEKAYEKLSVSVVSVSVYKTAQTPNENVPTSEGTGIVISTDGYIVTNSHVISDSLQSNVYITTKDKDVLPAVVVGNDTRTDIAVLKCQKQQKFIPAEFVSSDNLKVGQDVVAIGSPGGSNYSSSITKGIISALDRTLSGNANAYIQTDTAINPGNSGGPLATLNGQVVGINTIKIVDTQYEGMGFAIPSVIVKDIADSLIKYGIVKNRPQLGIMGQEISEMTAKSSNKISGIQIIQIDNDSPFKNTKVNVGDVITKINDVEVHSFYQLFSVLDSYEIGDTVTITLCRTDKKDNNKNEYFTVDIELIGE